LSGFQLTLAASASFSYFINIRFLNELEREGFFEELYK